MSNREFRIASINFVVLRVIKSIMKENRSQERLKKNLIIVFRILIGRSIRLKKKYLKSARKRIKNGF